VVHDRERIDLTTAMARLLTDSELRLAFRDDCEQLANELNLCCDDRAAFLGLDVDQLDQQADGLISKRREEVARLIPETWQRLGPSSDPLFRSFAESFWPASHKRHTEDAVAFAKFLQAQSIIVVYQPELNWRQFQLSDRRWRFCWIRDYLVNEEPHRALQLLYRWRGRHYQQFIT